MRVCDQSDVVLLTSGDDYFHFIKNLQQILDAIFLYFNQIEVCIKLWIWFFFGIWCSKKIWLFEMILDYSKLGLEYCKWYFNLYRLKLGYCKLSLGYLCKMTLDYSKLGLGYQCKWH